MNARDAIELPRNLGLDQFDAGDIVLYVPTISQRTGHADALEFGKVSSRNEEFVFVKFKPTAVAGMACSPTDLLNLTHLYR